MGLGSGIAVAVLRRPVAAPIQPPAGEPPYAAGVDRKKKKKKKKDGRTSP